MSAKVIKNGTVIAFDEETESITVLPQASVLISDGRVSAISKRFDDLTIPRGAEVIDATGKIVSPGFVDTHRHLWQTAYRTLAPNATVASYFLWLGQFSKAKDAFSPEEIYISSLCGLCDALNGGTTTLVEHAHNNWAEDLVEAGLSAAHDSGARIWWCYDPHHRDNFSFESQVELWKDIVKRHRGKASLVSLGVAYDDLEHATEAEVDAMKALVRRDLNLEVITMHLLGGPWPVGNNSPELAQKRGLLNGPTPVIFSHGGFVTDNDMRALRENNQYLSVTVESEMHFGHGHTRSQLIQDQASLGIDSGWAFGGDLMTQARLWLQSVRLENYNKTLEKGLVPNKSPMTVMQAYLLATRHGGLALRRKDIGVLKVGAKADIVIFRGDSPNMIGWEDPVAAIVLHANVGDIEHVLVDGDFRKRDGHLILKTGTWEELSAKFKETAARIQKTNKVPPPLPETFFGQGKFGDVEVVETGKLQL